MEKLYKIRYKPTGMYYSGNYHGSHPLNKNGKIYKTPYAAKEALRFFCSNAKRYFPDIDVNELEIVEFTLTEVGIL